MSEPKKKPKLENKRQKSKITNNKSLTSGRPHPKKMTVLRKILPDDSITKSKQLVQKLQTTKSSSYGRPKNWISKKDDEPRLCGNGKPMPSLSELEKMFEDSDDGDEEKEVAISNNITTTSTPEKNPELKSEKKLMSPTIISEIANQMLNLVSNISDPTEFLEDGPRPPVIKPKKRKKPDRPYIVGCKDRPKVPQTPTDKFCKGDEKYYPESVNREDDDYLPKKRAKRVEKINISKSIFNAKTDDIAACLKECDGDSDGSSDSNKTVAYEYYTPINSGGLRSFSPLPSTSKDNETFVKNDQRFNESLISENLSKTNLEDDIEILETPCETIEIIDTITFNNTKSKLDGSIIEITDDGSTKVFSDKLIATNKTVEINDNDNLRVVDVKPDLDTDINTDDYCMQVVDVKPASPILVEDYYSNLDIENISNDDVCEIIDIDNIIAENKAIIEKYSKTSNLDTVTLVDTSCINTTVQSNFYGEEKNSNLEKTVKVTKPTENHNVVSNSNRNLLRNEQTSIIYVNNNESSTHRPILVENFNEDVVVIETSNYPLVTGNTSRNRRAVQSVPINLESSLQNSCNRNQKLHNNNNTFTNSQSIVPSHRFNCVTERRETEQRDYHPQSTNQQVTKPTTKPTSYPPSTYCHHLTGTELRMRGDRCVVNCEILESEPRDDNCSTLNDDSYQKHLKILDQFFKRSQRNDGNWKKKSNKRNPRSSENILSQHFTSWLQSMTNNNLPAGAGNNRIQPKNHTPSPALTTTDSPDKTSKRIGDCPICMDSLSNKPIVSTICGHIFCMECIKLSIMSNGNKCPTCRKALKKGTGYHQIFL